jgi:hypothetical protein
VRTWLDEVAATAERSTSVAATEIDRWRSDVEDALAGRWAARPVATDR